MKNYSRAIALLGTVVFGVPGLYLAGVIIYVFATDGVANLRGMSDTGFGAFIAIFVFLPIDSVLWLGFALSWKYYRRSLKK